MKRESFSSFVPFSGFYYSLHSDIIDENESMLFHDPSGDPYQNLADIFYDHVDYRSVFQEYAKLYVDLIRELTELKSIQFEELQSPREYNFTTDRIFVSLSRCDLAKILRRVRGRELNKKIEELYTRRSGFISFYPNHISKWPPIEEWDHNHVGAALSAYLEGIEHEIAEKMYCDGSVQGFLYDAADYVGRSAVDLASIKYRLEEESLYSNATNNG